MLDEFTKCLERVNFYLRLIGLCPDIQDDQKTMIERLCNHRFYVLHLVSFNFEVIAEVLWLIVALKIETSFLEITYLFPCLTLCLLSNFKSFCALIYAPCINDLLDTLNKLQLVQTPPEPERDHFVKKLISKYVSELNSISNKMGCLIVIGIFMFGIGPLLIMLAAYFNTGEVELMLPFIAYYPFDISDIRYYSIVYVHQVSTAVQAIFFVYGPDCLFFTCCTFINIQFLLLQYDMERVTDEDVSRTDRELVKLNIKKLAVRHVQLMRCVKLLETIYSKSILFNACTSSIIICITGFNVMEIDNIVTMASFTSFLSFGLIQIFLYCYYSDNVMRSSMRVSNAIYNSQWYNVDVRERQSFFIILIRAQKPCVLTANGFFDINLTAFTNILSKSWSFFALLNTMYHHNDLNKD